MSKKKYQRIISTLAFVLVAVGCNDSSSPTEPETTTPDEVETTTETFAGEITMESRSCHTFAVTNAGNISMRLTALEPLETLTVGLGIGQPGEPDEDGEVPCTLFAQDSAVRVGANLVSAVQGGDDYCVCVLDVGNIFPDVTVAYTIEVEHP